MGDVCRNTNTWPEKHGEVIIIALRR